MRSLTKNDGLSVFQLCALTAMGMGMGIPNLNVTFMSPYRQGFITNCAFAVALTLIALIPVLLLIRAFPGRTLYEYSPELLGKYGGAALNGAVVLLAVWTAAGEIRPTMNVLRSYLLPHTPVAVTTALMIAAACYALRGGVSSVARCGEFFFVTAAFCLAVVIAMAVPYLDFTYFSRHLRFAGVGRAAEAAFSVFSGFFPTWMLLFFAPFARRGRLFAPLTVTVAATGAVFLLMAAVVTSVFGGTLPTEMFSPLLELSKLIGTDSGLMPERSNIIFMVLYRLLPRFFSCVAALYIAALGLVGFFPRLKPSATGVIVSLCAYGLLLVPLNNAEMIAAGHFCELVQVGFLPVILLLLIINAFRRRRTGLCAYTG
ncbi:MAG: GerAB/ArcD/ProY family transporter [Clostridia bacterium]|nr:GerAB/ArcD/ProY family transporter [Clostridia bacterium]